jgi:hypothetical protein
MKKLYILAFFLLLTVAIPRALYAQETETQPITNSNEDQHQETALQDLETTPKIIHSKQDSTATRALPKTKTTTEKIGDKKVEEESGPFNFLYYIIQRFKSSDIIEE